MFVLHLIIYSLIVEIIWQHISPCVLNEMSTLLFLSRSAKHLEFDDYFLLTKCTYARWFFGIKKDVKIKFKEVIKTITSDLKYRIYFKTTSGRRDRDCMVVGFTIPMQSVPITINAVNSNLTQAIQHFVIKFVSDLRQVSGVFRFPQPIKLTPTI